MEKTQLEPTAFAPRRKGRKRRDKGAGTVYRVHTAYGDRWRAEKWVPYQGKKIRVTGTAVERKDARKLCLAKTDHDYLAERVEGEKEKAPACTSGQQRVYKKRSAAAVPSKSWRVDEFFDWWQERRRVEGVRPPTLEGNRLLFGKYIRTSLGTLIVGQLTPAKVEQWWYEELLKDNELSSVPHKVYALIRSMFNFLKKRRVATAGLLLSITPPGNERKEITPRQMKQWKESTVRLFKWLNEEVDGQPRYMTTCGMAYYVRLELGMLGMRQTEALGVTWDKVHYADAVPYLRIDQILGKDAQGRGCIRPGTKTTKPGEGRDVPTTPSATEALRVWRELQKPPKRGGKGVIKNLVITQDNGKCVSPQLDRARFKQLLIDSGTPPEQVFSVGRLRHVVASSLGAEYITADESAVMGHSPEVRDKHYLIREVDMARVREGLESIRPAETAFRRPM